MSDVPVLIDDHEVLVSVLRNELAAAEGNAVMAAISQRKMQILDTLAPGTREVTDELARVTAIAEARRARADGLASRLAEVTGQPIDLTDVVDMRLEVARQLHDAQVTQVTLDERSSHAELYAVTAAEAQEQQNIAREAGRGPIATLTVEQIMFSALEGRAWVQALNEWLTDHPDGPALPEVTDGLARPAVDALRAWLNAASSSTDRLSAKRAK